MSTSENTFDKRTMYKKWAYNSIELYEQVLQMGFAIPFEVFMQLRLGPIGLKEQTIKAALEAHRLKTHRINVLARTEVKETKVSKNYYRGSETWQRQTGSPLTQEDLDSLAVLNYGQGTKVTGNPGDFKAYVTWVCDSGD